MTEALDTLLKERYNQLVAHFEIDWYDEEDEWSQEGRVKVFFPDDSNDLEYTIEEFLLYTEDLSSIRLESESVCVCKGVTQILVTYGASLAPDISSRIYENESCQISLKKAPFLFGLINSQRRNFDDDYGIYPASSYVALEIRYKDVERMNIDEELNLCKSVLYDISKDIGESILIDKIYDIKAFESLLEGEDNIISNVGGPTRLNIETLPKYSPLMDMYGQALTAQDNEIAFLYYYKIIESVGPIVAREKAYALLNSKLDLLSTMKRSQEYLDAIFDLARNYDKSIHDSEIAVLVLEKCVDLISMKGFIPEIVKKKVAKSENIRDIDAIDYSKKYEDDFAKLRKGLAKVLYSTRNNIVHAKKNYSPTGSECPLESLGDLNKFMSLLGNSIINWNDRLSDTLRYV